MRRRSRPLAGSGLVAVVVLAAVVAACGVPTDDKPRAISREQAPDLDEGEQGTSVAVTDTATLFLTRGDGAVRYLAPLEEQVPVGPSAIGASPATALETLLSYTPSETLRTEGFASRIPPDTVLASTPELDDHGVLVVDLNSNINNVQGDGSRLAFGQMVCTADTFEEVQAVRFEVEGEPRAAPKGDGESTDEPLACTSYANLFPDANG
jgi:spore germination protein GerM